MEIADGLYVLPASVIAIVVEGSDAKVCFAGTMAIKVPCGSEKGAKEEGLRMAKKLGMKTFWSSFHAHSVDAVTANGKRVLVWFGERELAVEASNEVLAAALADRIASKMLSPPSPPGT